jgi:hypothetical protein
LEAAGTIGSPQAAAALKTARTIQEVFSTESSSKFVEWKTGGGFKSLNAALVYQASAIMWKDVSVLEGVITSLVDLHADGDFKATQTLELSMLLMRVCIKSMAESYLYDVRLPLTNKGGNYSLLALTMEVRAHVRRWVLSTMQPELTLCSMCSQRQSACISLSGSSM